MGQKTRPAILRIGINKDWDSSWFADKESYADYLHQDLAIRNIIYKAFQRSGINQVIIERPAKKLNITIHTSRPGVLIGKKGADIDNIKKLICKKTDLSDIQISIQETKKPEVNAKLAAESIAQQLEKRVSYRKAIKRVISSAMKFGAKGIRVNVSGRLGGAEIARMEWQREGQVPLHTLRANIDYGVAEARTGYGIIGIKVWIYTHDQA